MTLSLSRLAAVLLVCSFASTPAVPAHAAPISMTPVLNAEGAERLATLALDYARAHGAPGAAIAIVDPAGHLLYLKRLDGTFENAADIAAGKARTAALFGKPTRVLEDAVNKGRHAMLALPAVASFTPLMGGVPIEIGHKTAGAIGVSGAASGAQDEEIASAAAASFAAEQAQRSTSVIHLRAREVEDGFRRGAMLASDVGYRINASKRDAPGEAEVHRDDTDIFYIVSGTAELVTGGEVLQPRQVSDTESLGTEITGGNTLQLAPGDVVTIPRGVPHWFKRVKAPFRYLVIKSSAP